MASQNAEFVVSLMRSGKVTENEAMTFMGTALTRMENSKPGSSVAFMKDLIALRATRTFPDMSGYMR